MACLNRSSSVRSACAPASSTRAELCGDLKALTRQKEELWAFTQRQKLELHEVEGDVRRLRANLASLDAAEADLVHEGADRQYARDVAKLELQQLTFERQQLQRELNTCQQAGVVTWRQARARSRLSQTSTSNQHNVLATELQTLINQLAAQEELLARRESADPLPEGFENQRGEQTVMELELERMQAKLARVRSERQKMDAVQALKVEADRRRLAEARLQLTVQTEVRRAQEVRLQAAASRMGMLKREVHEASAAAPHRIGGSNCMTLSSRAGTSGTTVPQSQALEWR
mmetsp:Transcript_17482/g.31565  ORF Transcript_17482/g.31565 Transcript_17482/m.31565 type:complete len:289 (+) Transcript_17482:53-919(+)